MGTLPGTAMLWMLPLVMPWLALLDMDFAASPRVFRILAAGTASIAALLAIGLWAAWRTRGEALSHRRRVVLWTFLAAAGVLGVVTICLAENSSFAALALAPMLTWLLGTFLIPLWRDDSELVDPREPDTGWKRLFGMRMVYSNPRNPALWVRMRTPLLSTDMGYTPNLGHFWGGMAIAMLFLSLVAAMAVSIVAWTAR